MALTIVQVDAFTDTAFAGNPAAVCLLPEPRDELWMQHVAREMNLSETAFLHRREDGFDLRWFTPTVEVDLCGHATLASAHVLWEEGHLQSSEEARFFTRSGLLTAQRDGALIELDFPLEADEPVEAPPDLVRALAITPKYVGKNRFDYVVEVDSETTVREMKPDFSLLQTLPVRGVIVTSLSASSQFDYVCRFFAPAAGVNEDPVTGSAQCCLAPFWQQRLKKDAFLAYQASLRGGNLRVRLSGDRVQVGGKAITVFRAELLV